MKSDSWITVNGAHIPLGKEGKPINEVGKKIAAETKTDNISLKADMELYARLLEEHGGNHLEAAKAYYDSELKGGI